MKGIIFPKNNPREKIILPPSEVLLYIDYARASKYAPLILLELCAGLRHEEACAVTKEDIKICGAAAYINIDKARVTVGGRVVEKDTKNSYSSRVVPVRGCIAQLLSAFTVEPVNPQTATHNWREWCKRHKIKYVPFGQMRTNFITLACECAPASLVDLYVGHSDGSVRMKHYQKATKQGLLAVAQAYEEYVCSK